MCSRKTYTAQLMACAGVPDKLVTYNKACQLDRKIVKQVICVHKALHGPCPNLPAPTGM